MLMRRLINNNTFVFLKNALSVNGEGFKMPYYVCTNSNIAVVLAISFIISTTFPHLAVSVTVLSVVIC